ncbi:MAG: hypothetical protein E6J23_10225 [Chloroflexi bacterium]|nr:MAG: hypothetical protein E6J23_10225 [Chloroflexota bacterium]
MKAAALALALILASSCGVIGSLRPGPTIAPLISAAFLSVHLFVGDQGDAQERSRIPELRDAIAAALPNAWSTATAGRGQLSLRTDGDIDMELDGTDGTSALTQHSSGGRVISRKIAVHTVEGPRRLTIAELMATVLHELGHIWCCFGPGTKDGHWTDAPKDFSTVGLMYSPMTCRVSRGSDPICPSVFSERELAEMRLNGP